MSIRGIRRALVIPRLTRKHVEREVDDEIAFHVAHRAEQLRAAGMSGEEAYAEAVRRFGDVAWVRDECVDVDHGELRRDRVTSFFDHLRGDVRFALRSLRRAPGLTAVALTTLVVGIASVTAIFSVVYAYAFRPLPYHDANRIVAIEERRPGGPVGNWTISPDAAHALLGGSRSFERIALFQSTVLRTSIAGKPSQLWTLRIDSSFTPLFALHAQRGRMLTNDEIAANAPVAMMSDVLWRASFGADPAVIGRPIRLGDELITIVGVMPSGFRYPYQTDIWRPFHLADSSAGSLTLLGKLAPGVTRRALGAELAVVSRRLAQSDSQQFSRVTFVAQEMINRQGGGLPIAFLFVGAAVLVLLIACSNVANLLLVRAAERRGEMAVRSSLGAGRARLLTQALMEAVVLAAAAGVFGALLSSVLIRIAIASVPTAGFPSWLTFGIDGRILLFVIAIVSLVTLAVGLTPAREGTRFDLARALKAGGDAGTVNSGVARSARRAIVVQLALSVVLFVGASLLVQTYWRLAFVDVGYPAEEIVSLQPFFDPQRYPNDSAMMRFAAAVQDRASEFGGIRHSAIRGSAQLEPLSGAPAAPTPRARQTAARADLRLFADGDTTRDRERRLSSRQYPRYFAVSDEYFRTLDLRITRGRSLSPNDEPGSQLVVVLSRRFADLLWGKENPIGRTVEFGAHGRPISVVGIVEDVRDVQGGQAGVSADPRADAYFSIRQVGAWQPEVLFRGSKEDVAAIQAAVQAAARRVDPELLTSTFTLARSIEAQRLMFKLLGALLGSFAICGLILSIIGIYGVVAFGIAQRTREIGIRIALGGTNRDVLRLVLRQALRFVGTGLAVGVILSLAAARLLRALLFGVTATDPVTYAAVCIVFGGVAVVACYLPARRVTRVDPLIALRTD